MGKVALGFLHYELILKVRYAGYQMRVSGRMLRVSSSALS